MIDYEKIKKIYGEEVLKLIYDNNEEFLKNMQYLYKLGLSDVYELVQRYTPIFIEDNLIFSEKINQLINKIGPDYIEVLSNDSSYFMELL